MLPLLEAGVCYVKPLPMVHYICCMRPPSKLKTHGDQKDSSFLLRIAHCELDIKGEGEGGCSLVPPLAFSSLSHLPSSFFVFSLSLLSPPLRCVFKIQLGGRGRARQ
jgi:hypothetical protein